MSRWFWFRIPVPDRLPFVPLSFRAMLKGRRDGRLGLPSAGQEEYAPFEFRVKQKMDYGMRHLTADWHRLDGRLHERYCRLESTIAMARPRLADLRRALEELRREQSEAEGSHVPLLKHLRLNRWLYRLLITALVIGEYPLNAQVFAILGENTALTMLFAATLALSLPLAAHFLGLILKRLSFEPIANRTERVFAVVIIVMPFAVMAAIAYLREKYIEATDVLETLGLAIDPTTATLVFLSINTLIFTIGAIASYYAHDPELDHSELALRKASLHLDTCRQQIDALEEEVRRSQVEQQATAAQRRALLEEYRLRGESIRDYMAIILDIYREQNMASRARKRGDTTVPKTFGRYPPIKRADALPSTLDWSCGGARPTVADPAAGQETRAGEP